ncbi:MAG: hypothetical protein QOK40_2944, partial [Miltoncostaeaceae bacterium]|nr:hypothetical protein [Miltoncostaeaceae bacterium]
HGFTITTRSFCDGLVGFRLDLEPAAADGRRARTVATDYDPLPLSLLDAGLEGDDPEAALDALAPRLRAAARVARPTAIRPRAGAGDATLRLHAAIVCAPVVARERTSAAEIAAQLSGWREITTFGWHDAPGLDPGRSAYELLGRLDIAG